MEPSLVATTLVLALLVGVSLGLLGGGGSILTVPIMTYLVGMEPREAIAASLVIVGVTSAVGTIGHARAGRVRWKTGLLFASGGIAGAFLGGSLGRYIPGAVLMVLFALVMIVTAVAMIRGRKPLKAQPEAPNSLKISAHMVTYGLLVGTATGLLGAGGGFLIVPALNLLGGLPMVFAVATSLFVITLNSIAGLSGHLLSEQVQWPIVVAFTAATVAGSFLGVALMSRFPEVMLRRVFGMLVLLVGVFVLVQEVGPLVYA